MLITHRLADALAVADDVTVLRQGASILSAPRETLDEHSLITAVVGELDVVPTRPRVRVANGEVLFALHDVSVDDARGIRRLERVSLEVRAGEVLGVLGVEGSGHHELLRLLAGRLEPTSGQVIRPLVTGFVPEDRLLDALIPSFTLTENVALSGGGVRRGLLSWSHVAARTAEIVRAFDVRTAGVDSPVSSLSGGNQQRFVVGRERTTAPRAIVAENPTRGLDVRAAQRVVDAVLAVADTDGGAAVVYSSDLEELLALTARIVVCAAGRVVEVPPPKDPNDRTPYVRALMGLAL